MPNNDLKILITAGLNHGKSIGEINTAIKGIQQKVDKLRLNVEVNDKVLASLNNFSKQMKNIGESARNAGKYVEEITNPDGSKIKRTFFDGIKEDFKQTETAAKKTKVEVGQLVDELDDYGKKIKEIQRLNAKGETIGTTSVFKDDNNILRSVSADNNGKVLRTQIIDNIEQIENAEKKSQKEMRKALVKTGQVRRSEYEKSEQAQADAIHRTQELEFKRNEAEQLRVKKLGDKKLSGIQNFDQASLEKYIRSVYGANAEIKKLDKSFDKAGNEVWKFNAAVNQGKGKILEYKGSIDRATRSMRQHGNAASKTIARDLSMIDQFKIAASRIPIWMAGMSAFYFPLRQVQKGISEIYSLDKAMINLKKVTDETTQSYKDFGMEANQMATSIGSTTVDIIKATTEFSRLGYEMNQAKSMAQQAMVFANVGDTNFEDASKSLISTMKGFNIEADAQGKNITKIVDLYNEIGNSFAISTSGVGAAMRRSSASLKSAGNTIEESVALVVAANSAIQDPVKVGTAWKTVSMRIRGISEEGEDLSHLIPTLEKSFDKLGLSLKKNDNTFKSTYAIMQDLSRVWKDMSDFEQADILEKIAGKRQGNIIAAAITNFADAQKAVEVGLNSQGSAAKELENYLGGIEAKMNMFTNSMVGFWQTALNSEGLKDVVEIGTKFVKLLTTIVDKFGLLSPIVGTAALAIIALNNSMRVTALSTGMRMGQTIKYVTSSMYALATGTATTNRALLANAIAVKGVTVSLRGLKVAAASTMAFLGGAILPIGGLVLLGLAIEKLISSHMKAKEQAKKAEAEEKKLLDTWTQQGNKIRTLIEQNEKLNKVTEDGSKFKSIEQEQEYLDIQNELGSLLPSLVKSVDENNNAHLRSSTAISEEVKLLEELVNLKKEEKFLNSQQDFLDSKSEIEKLIEERDKLDKILKSGVKETFEDTGEGILGGGLISAELTDRELINLEIKINQLQTEINKSTEGLVLDNFMVNVEFALDDRELTQEAKQVIQDLGKTMDFLSMSAEEYEDALKDVAGAFSLVESNSDTKFLFEYANATGMSYGFLLKLKESLSDTSDEMDGLTDSVEQHTFTMEELLETYKNTSSEVSTLNKLLRDVAEGKKLSAVEAMELIAKEGELSEAISIENGIVKINTELVQEMRDKKISAYTDPLNAEIKSVEVQSKILLQRLGMYQTEGEAIEQLAQAKLALLGMGSEDVIGSMIISDARNEVNNVTKHLEKLNKLKALAVEGLNGVGVDTGSSTSSTSTSSSKAPVDPYSTDTFAQSMDELNTEIDQLQGKLSQLDNTTEEYRNGQRELIDLYQQQQELTHKKADDLRNENDLIKSRLDTEKLTTEERNKLKKQYDDNKAAINSLSREWWNYKSNIIGANKAVSDSFDEITKQLEEQQKLFEENQKKWVENLESATDKAIDLIKDHYKDRQKLAQEAIDEELNELERLHEEKTKLLDEDLKKYEEIINAQLRTIDRTSDEEDFSRELSKAEQERLELTQKIHVLSLDDSLEARAKKQELEEELAKKTEEIERMKNRRTKDLRKQNLQDILENKRKETEEIKSRDQETYDASKTLLEQRKEDETQYWQEKIDNDRYFSKLREEVLDGNIKNLTTILQTFALDVEQAMTGMGKVIDENLAKFNLKNLGRSGLENIQDDLEDAIGGLEDAEKNKTPYDSSVNKKDPEQFNNDFKKYIASKIEWYEISKTNKTGVPTNRQEELHQQNQNLRKKYPSLLDYTIDDLVDMGLASYDKGGMTPSWGSSGKLGILHEEEMIFDKIDTSKILKVANIAENIMRNFKTIDFSKMTPNINQSIQPSNSITISIGSVIGDRKGAEQVSNHIIKRLSAKGVI